MEFADKFISLEQKKMSQEKKQSVEEDCVMYRLPKSIPELGSCYREKKVIKDTLSSHLENDRNLRRRLVFDISPHLIYSTCDLVQLLARTKVAKYIEFRGIPSNFVVTNDKKPEIHQLPVTKSSLFHTKLYTNAEKLKLAKLTRFLLGKEHPSKEERSESDQALFEKYRSEPFISLLEQLKLTEQMKEHLLYSISLQPFTQKDLDVITTEEALPSVKSFLLSLGRHTNGAFLYVSFGAGELPQAWSRLCAIHSGVFILRWLPRKMAYNTKKDMITHVVTPEKQKLHIKNIVAPLSYLKPMHEFTNMIRTKKIMQRMIIVTKKPLPSTDVECRVTQQGLKLKSSSCVVVISPNTKGFDNPNPIQVIQHDKMSRTTTGEYCVIYLSTPVTTEKEENKEWVEEQILKNAVNLLFSDESDILYQALFQQEYREVLPEANLPKNLFCVSDPSFEISYQHALEEARSIFHKILPNEEFHPKRDIVPKSQTSPFAILDTEIGDISSSESDTDSEAEEQSGERPQEEENPMLQTKDCK